MKIDQEEKDRESERKEKSLRMQTLDHLHLMSSNRYDHKY
jgi:hypothetical protein